MTNPSIISILNPFFISYFILACGGSLTGNYGTFSSPGYPNSYQNNLMCTYSIRVDPGKTVNLIFNDFQLEEDITCRFDFISIRDYDSSNAGRDLGKYCGTRVPAQVKSSGNELWVLFKSDGSVGKRGFRAVWNAIDSSGATAVASTTSTTASKVAGQKTDPLTLEPEATPTRG